MIKVIPISFQTISDKLIKLAPELLLLQIVYSIIRFYFHYFNYLYSKLNRFLIIITNRFFQNLFNIKSRIFQAYKRDNILNDLSFACNLITIACGNIWFYLHWQNSYKQGYAYYITTWTSLVGYIITSAIQFNTYQTIWSSENISTMLKSETTFMIIITDLFIESKANSYKLILLMFHSILMLLGLTVKDKPHKSIVPFKGLLLFLFSMIEILVMCIFWVETFNQGLNQAMLFTICYLLKWEDSRTNQIVQNTTGYIRDLQEKKTTFQLQTSESTTYTQEFKRFTSFGFDTFSIISDIH